MPSLNVGHSFATCTKAGCLPWIYANAGRQKAARCGAVQLTYDITGYAMPALTRGRYGIFATERRD